MYTNKLYILETLTSLHVGSGDTNYGVIDNLVQKEILTQYPTIHSSSLKGALKEFMTHLLKYPQKDSDNEDERKKYNQLKYIFGDEDQAGMVRFIDAHLLALPQRSDTNPYYLCVSPQSIATYLELSQAFGFETDKRLQKVATYNGKTIVVKEGSPVIEDHSAISDSDMPWEALEKLVGSPVAIVPDKAPNRIFETFVEDLPVIARNQLENGESKNLFYEEVVPRKSKFFTVISFPDYINKQDQTTLQNAFKYFQDNLVGDELIQLGANASIGYGVTKFTEKVS